MMMPTSEEIVKVIRDGAETMKSKSWYRRVIVIRWDRQTTYYGPRTTESNEILPYLFDIGLFGYAIVHAEMQYDFPGYQIMLEVKKTEDNSTNIDADVLDAIRDFLEKEI